MIWENCGAQAEQFCPCYVVETDKIPPSVLGFNAKELLVVSRIK